MCIKEGKKVKAIHICYIYLGVLMYSPLPHPPPPSPSPFTLSVIFLLLLTLDYPEVNWTCKYSHGCSAGFMIAICNTGSWIGLIVTNQLGPILINSSLQVSGTLLLFSAVIFFLFLVVLFLMPETKVSEPVVMWSYMHIAFAKWSA